MDLVAAAEQIAEQLDGQNGVRAYVDPSKAWGNRPCLLVAPPTIDWTEGAMGGAAGVEWRVLALSRYAAGELDAVAELSVLVNAANEVLELERATPARYSPNAKNEPVAAYVCIHSEIQ